jgi:uncharacterized tellurite resistance protein B-like protein
LFFGAAVISYLHNKMTGPMPHEYHVHREILMVIKRLKDFFSSVEHAHVEEEDDDKSLRIQLATCVLLLEVAHSDDHFSMEEGDHILEILQEQFQLSEEFAGELMMLAHEERQESVDLWRFTNIVDNNYTSEEKERVMETLWKVIVADDQLHPKEEYLARRLAKLLNLTHNQFIEAKLRAMKNK